MAENPQIQNQNQSNTPTPDIMKILDSMSDFHQEGVITKKFDRMPLVFVEGHSLTKIAITKNYVNCSWSFDNDVEGLVNEGCFLYDNGEIEPVHGIYYMPPRIRFPMKRIMGPGVLVKDAKQKIKTITEHAKAQFNRNFDPNRWLIRYYNGQIRIYNYANLIKGETIKFSLVKKIYELNVVRMPRIESPLKHEVVRETQVGDYKILFNNDVIKFKIYSFGGWAQLIYIYNDDAVTEVDVRYNVSGEESHEKFEAHRGDLLLFAQGREPKVKTRMLVRDIKWS